MAFNSRRSSGDGDEWLLHVTDGILSSFELNRRFFALTVLPEGIEWSDGGALASARSEGFGAINLEALSELFHASGSLALLVLLVFRVDSIFKHAGLNTFLVVVIQDGIMLSVVHDGVSHGSHFAIGALFLLSKFK